MDMGRLVESEETFDKQIVSNLSVDSSTCVSEQYDSLSDEENSNQSSSLDYSLSSTSHSVSSGTNFNYSVENLKLSLSTNGNSASNNRMMNASLIVGGNETNLMSESFVNHSQVIVSNVGHSNHAFLPVVLQVSNEESQPKSNIVTFDKESCKDSVNIVNSIQKMMESQSKVEPEPCLFKHDNFRPIIKLSPQKHALFLKKKKMNRRETILNQVKLSSRLTGNKHSCRIGPAKRKDLSLDQIKNQRLDKKNNFHLELDLDILFTEKLVEKLPILVESSTQITETLFEMKDEKQTTPLTESPTNSTSSTSSPHHPCNFSCKYCNELNRNCTINNSIKETQHEVFNIVKYNLVKLKELLDSDDLDFEDSVDSVLESDCVQTLISYLDTSIYGKYFSLKKEGHSNSNSMSNLSMKDILSLQLVATQVVKKLSCGRIDQVETLTSKLTISKLILLINSMCDSVRYEALWICGNLAKHHHNFRDDLLDQNVLNEIVTLITGFSGSNLDEDTTSLLRMAAWCFSKLCFGTVFPKENHMRKEIELLDKFLAFEDSDILKNVCRALGRLMLPKEMIDVFLKTGRLPKIVDLLKHVDDNVIGQALVAAVNISAGTDEETQELVTLNALNVCHDILKSNKSRSIKVDAMILVSNIAACTEKQVECAVECGVLELVANLFHNRDTHIDMKKEAVWIFSNSTSNGTEQHLELFTEKYQILIPVAKMVMNCNDTNVVTLGLQTLLRIVQYYDEDKEPEQLAGVLAKLNECGADKYISQMDVNRYGTAAKLNKYFPKK